MALKILTYNVRGLNSPFKRSMFWRDALKSQADVICPQETHLLESDTHRLKHRKFPFIFHSSASTKRAGVSILVKDSIAFQLLSVTSDSKGRFVILRGIINSKKYTILSLYAPNSQQTPFLRNIISEAKKTKIGDLIICGDFNVVMDRSLDRSQSSHRYAQELNPLVNEEELHDVWRYLHATERDYSYYSTSKRTLSRIDFFLVDSAALPHVISSTIDNITWSDHASVSLTLQTNYDYSCRPPWRLNSYILKYPENIKRLSSDLNTFFEANAPSVNSPVLLWCTHKAYIRGLLIQVTARAKRKRVEKLKDILAELQSTEKIFKTNPTPQIQDKLRDLRNQLRLIYLHKFDFNLAKLKWNFYMQGDRPGKLLAKRVKQIQARNKIPYMFDKHKTKVHDPQKIADLFADYYQDLYNISESEPFHPLSADKIDVFLKKLSLPSLSSQQLEDLNRPVTIQEVQKTMNSSKLMKSPGPDGLPNEYYRTFADILAPHFQKVCQSFFSSLSPAEMLQATISTTPKPGKSLDDPANFRPISLLNSDIKFFSKILATRINSYLPSLISPDQVGFVPHRQARDGTRRVLDLI